MSQQNLSQDEVDALLQGMTGDVPVAETEGVKLCRNDGAVHAFGLVDHQEGRAPGAAQARGDLFVVGSEAVAGIHHEEHHIGLFDGQQGLLGHLQLDPLLGAIDTAGIDHDKFQLAQLRLAIFAVPGQAGEVGNQGIPGTGQASRRQRLRVRRPGAGYSHYRTIKDA